MDWKELGGVIAKSAPMLGGILGGPPGAAIGAVGAMIASALGVGNDPNEIATALTTNPDALVKLKEIESNRSIELQRILTSQTIAELQASTQNAGDINATMQAEAKSEHWPTYGWRPAIGFAVAFAVALSVLTVFAAYGAAIFAQKVDGLQHLPGILAAVAGIIAVVSPILGIASYFRGRMQADPSVSTSNRG